MQSNAYHHNEPRAFIPSMEEAGSEQDNPSVTAKTTADYPKNPVVQRGQDPELFWKDKYGPDDTDDTLSVDIRSLYRVEHVSPELLISKLYRTKEIKPAQLNIFEMFGNALQMDEFEKVSEYYTHDDDWKNRLIQGDSLLIMNSLLEREGMAGKVQMCYIDPPYGIKYNSNWQLKMNDRAVADGKDENLSGEPEQIKAFRDTWELGIHSYLSYLRDRLIVARDLLHVSGSCFVQISDENVHLVRCLMDEVFGSENFVSLITFRKTGLTSSKLLDSNNDYLIWYAKSTEDVKFNQLYLSKTLGGVGGSEYTSVELNDGSTRKMTQDEIFDSSILPSGARPFTLTSVVSDGAASVSQEIELFGRIYKPGPNEHWKTTIAGMQRLASINRLNAGTSKRMYKRYFDDFPVYGLGNNWQDVRGALDRNYVVQTTDIIIQRCLLMCTDPGDLVIDPTCGSGTTAYVAEQWGRRWITTDTSRIALNIAKTRLMTANFPYYHLYSDVNVERLEKAGKIKKTVSPKPANEQIGASTPGDIRQGFVYEEVPHITLKSLANDEPADTETLYDKPEIDKKRLRVSGPFTVETLQNFEPVSPADLDNPLETVANNGGGPSEMENFEKLVFNRLQSAGINNGDKTQHTKFTRVEQLAGEYLHAEGFYQTEAGEGKAYIHLGGKYSTVSKDAVNHAIRECRQRGDADWLLILGLSFESDIENRAVTTKIGSFRVDKIRLHDDFLQDGLMKKPNKSSGSFVMIGEPDIRLTPSPNGEGRGGVTVEVCGLDIYDPIKDDVRSRDPKDIAYWMVDDDYDGANFIVQQVFFCGSDDKDEFKKWEKGLSDLAKQGTKKQAEKTLKVEIDDEAFDRLYGTTSHPIEYRKGRKIAVRVISQFGEESTKVLTMQ